MSQARVATRWECSRVDWSLASMARASARIPTSAWERCSWSARSEIESSRTTSGS